MNITRRFFLQSTGALAVYSGIAPLRALAAAAPAVADARPVAAGKTLVVIFLRGGIDGLNLVVPHGDPNYAKIRQALRIPNPGQDNGALDLDGFFGMHPRAKALMPLFDSGHAVAAHAVGYSKNTRSHFEEQDRWETGVVGNTLGADGWLNRHLLTSSSEAVVRAIALSDTLPRILRGDAAAYAVRGLSDLSLPGRGGDTARVTAALEHAYSCTSASEAKHQQRDARDLVTQTGSATLEGVKLIREVAARPYQSAAKYNEKSSLAQRLQTAAQLIKADIGLEVIEVDYGGWDTHNNQGNGIEGNYGNKVQELAEALAAFATDLGDRLQDTLVLTLSDFGRTARENGTRGTDHGWANAMLALGGTVSQTGDRVGGPGHASRRKVVSDWPGLAPDQLYQNRDLAHTTDFRDVLGEVVRRHLGNPNLERVLPSHTFKPVGLIA